MEIKETDQLLNLTEAATFLNISRDWLYTLIERGELKPVQIADRQFLKFTDLREYKNNKRG